MGGYRFAAAAQLTTTVIAVTGCYAHQPVDKEPMAVGLDVASITYYFVHTKLAASSVLPLPLYRATCG